MVKKFNIKANSCSKFDSTSFKAQSMQGNGLKLKTDHK